MDVYRNLWKNQAMEVLIDNVLEKCDVYGYVYGMSFNELRRVRFIETLKTHSQEKEENFWCVSHGHVFVFNYNSQTIKKTLPLTYKDWQDKND